MRITTKFKKKTKKNAKAGKLLRSYNVQVEKKNSMLKQQKKLIDSIYKVLPNLVSNRLKGPGFCVHGVCDSMLLRNKLVRFG